MREVVTESENLTVNEIVRAKEIFEREITEHIAEALRTTKNENRFCVKTAEGAEGWVYSEYISSTKQTISHQEALNRTYRLPSNGKVNTEGRLNIRNIPSLRDSQVVEQLEPGTPVTRLYNELCKRKIHRR